MTEGPTPSLHRAWVEVDHAALRHNLGALRRLAGPEKQVIAVVKANAYGHGAIEVSRTLLAEGVELLAVATIDEGIALRRAGIAAPIVVLWALGRPEAALAGAHDLQPVVHDAAGIAMLDGAADPGRRLGRAPRSRHGARAARAPIRRQRWSWHPAGTQPPPAAGGHVQPPGGAG